MSTENKPAKPGEAALQNMKLLKSESSVFKVPKVPQQKKHVKKAHVLEEDVYVEGIAKIIQRDFFPDLEKLNAQNEYLEASENKDYARLRAITRKYSGRRPPTEPYNSPATFDTPDVDRPQSPLPPTERGQPPQSESATKQEKPKDIIDNHTLDSFLANHTSEDNASYDRITALEDRKRANKLAVQFSAEATSRALADANLVLPSIEQQADQSSRPEELDTWRYTAKNHIMYVPDGAESQAAPPRAELRHHNTRLRTQPFDHARNKEAISAIARTQDATISGRIGVDGVSISAERGAGGAGGAGAEYGFVATPSPRPGAGADQSPLMTWGEIEGTPFRLDGGDTPVKPANAGAAYRMLEGGARERIALQLAEQAARRRRPTTPRAPATPHSPASVTPRTPFRTNTERLASMSPAARKLAAKHLWSPRLKLTPHDVGIYHPSTPKRTAARTPRRSPLVASKGQQMPVAARASETDDNNLTDNLLQINVAKRVRLNAQDFFQG